jgi:cell division transport system permease protein
VSALGRPGYFVRRALQAMARGPRVALVATTTIAVAVFLTGLFAAALHGAERLVAVWGGDAQLSVYLDPAADLEAARAAAAALAPGLAVELVRSDEALRRFRASLGPEGALLDGVRPEVLPPSVEVRAAGLRAAEAQALAARLRAVPGARDVDDGHAWLARLEALVAKLRWAGVALFVALAAGAAVLVANTLRLGVFARRDEIEIMRLVGATDSFVQAPFLIEGLLQGLAGGALGAAALSALAGAALPRLAAVTGEAAALSSGAVLAPPLLAALVGGGAALGLFASALAVGREMKGP